MIPMLATVFKLIREVSMGTIWEVTNIVSDQCEKILSICSLSLNTTLVHAVGWYLYQATAKNLSKKLPSQKLFFLQINTSASNVLEIFKISQMWNISQK